VHAELKALGFLEFVASRPDSYLFELDEQSHRRSHSASRDLAKIFKETGVEKTMHQLHHTMRDLLTEAGVDWAITQAIMGHTPTGQSARYGTDIKKISTR
jgi:integrase